VLDEALGDIDAAETARRLTRPDRLSYPLTHGSVIVDALRPHADCPADPGTPQRIPNMRHPTTALLLIAVLTAAPGAAQTNPQSDRDLKEIAEYRLTMDGLRKMMTVMRTLAEEMRNDPKVQARMKVDAEIKPLTEKEELTEAEEKRLEELRMKLEQLEQEEDNAPSRGNNNPQTLSEMAAQVERQPTVAAALRKAGMSPREYSTFMLAMMQAGMVAGFKKTGHLKELPKGVSAENVKFIEDHEAELKAWQEEMERLNKKGGG
jgi:hypothetical protein